jgi:hypothetical protein
MASTHIRSANWPIGFNGFGYAAVNEGYGIVSADHIKSIPKLKHIFENRYRKILSEKCFPVRWIRLPGFRVFFE